MMEGWDKMSVVERQDACLAAWASGDGLPFADDKAKAAYQERTAMCVDVIQMKKKPTRVPVMPLTTFAPVMLAGATGRQAMYDPKTLGQVYVDFCLEYQPDFCGSAPMVMYGPTLDTLGYQLYKWPGHGVAEHLSYQFVEKEYMGDDEYDALIADPTDFWLRRWLPRTCRALAPLANVPPVYGSMELPMFGPFLAALGSPEAQEALKALMEAGRQTHQWLNELLGYLVKIMSLGFPFYAGGATKAPYDTISDAFRGTTQMMMDMYRRPQKILDAMDRLVEPMINSGAGGLAATGNPLIFIPLHKGADGFMSDEQFKKFYWPTLKAVMYGLAERGCTPVCFVEGGYNQRLDYLAETSDIRSVYLFDRTDMTEVARKLGGKVTIGGGFPVSLILTGTPAQVSDATKKLIDDAAGQGGYILSIGTSLDEAKEDTLKAFIRTGKEYGRY